MSSLAEGAVGQTGHTKNFADITEAQEQPSWLVRALHWLGP